MKPLLLGLCLLCSAAVAIAQPQSPDPFSPFSDAPVASRSQKVPFAVLAKSGQMALLSLRQPLNGTNRALAVAWGRDAVLLSIDDAFQLKPLKEVEALYSGEALVPITPASALVVDNAVQIVPITSLGEDAQVVARYSLRNSGKTPLDVSVASTSCGCTAATLEKSHLDAGQSTTLTATMHADSERLVRVTLQTNGAAPQCPILALQSRQTFAPFQGPSPVSLFGEKGQSLTASTEFELPAGWTIARVSVQPDWLQTSLKLQPATQTPATQVAALPRFQLAVSAPASAPEGALQGQVKLELRGAPLQFLSVPVGGFVSNDISASPRMIVLNDSPLGLARRTVVVHGPRPFSIRAITSNINGFQAHFEPNIEARAHAVELLVPVGGKKGDSFFERAQVELSDGRELPLDLAGTVGVGTLPALAEGVHLNERAPDFSGLDLGGQTVSLASLRGKNVLLTFFPHCFTGGCESHLASLRDAFPALVASGTQVVAVSTDDANMVRAFSDQLKLPFPVVSDPTRTLALAFGAVQDKAEAPSRLSFLLDQNGVVRWIDTDVRVRSHGADVLARLGELGLARSTFPIAQNRH